MKKFIFLYDELSLVRLNEKTQMKMNALLLYVYRKIE